MQATLEQLKQALMITSWSGVIVPADQHCDTDYLNLYPDSDIAVRYPSDTVWPPTAKDDRWTWGPNFEHAASADIAAIDLAERIELTVKLRD